MPPRSADTRQDVRSEGLTCLGRPRTIQTCQGAMSWRGWPCVLGSRRASRKAIIPPSGFLLLHDSSHCQALDCHYRSSTGTRGNCFRRKRKAWLLFAATHDRLQYRTSSRYGRETTLDLTSTSCLCSLTFKPAGQRLIRRKCLPERGFSRFVWRLEFLPALHSPRDGRSMTGSPSTPAANRTQSFPS
jgi:hypothetical protein